MQCGKEYDLDDPDCDSTVVDTPDRFANQINNINLPPSTTSADEDGLASLFSMWGDENPMHSSLDDFEHGSVHCPIAAGNTCEANNNYNAGFDEDDEFAAAVHDANAKTGFPSVQLLSGKECGASTSLNYAWSINHGDKYATASAFYAFVEQKFCKECNFLVRKTSTCKKAPKGIPEGCHPPDGIYSQRVICTLAGASAAKKEGIPEEKRRNRKSLKCGCQWGVRGRWIWQMKQYVLQVDKEKNLVHTNGCNPTPQQQIISITKRTTGKLQRIPLYVLEDMKVMFDEGQPISFIIRRRIRNRIPLHIKTDARWFMNLRVTIEREKLTKQARTSVCGGCTKCSGDFNCTVQVPSSSKSGHPLQVLWCSWVQPQKVPQSCLLWVSISVSTNVS